MRACSHNVANAYEIVRLAASDPVLAAELLRVVNSLFFSIAWEIKSIPRAVTILGHKLLRNLQLRIYVRDTQKQGVIEEQDSVNMMAELIPSPMTSRSFPIRVSNLSFHY